ncbi:ABC transporter substrate-binding protein [Salinicola peritrichatus]|uniref:ABC transporter substrate-binding protein n=1 Tax=Salinicola peritrichatus TaxID=1267424 RepID=UPI0013A637B4|nr:ABC transporter substrate-binding protein [Salinicola peritrichatus]
MKKTSLWISSLTLGIALQAPAAMADPVRIALNPWIGHGGWHIAESQGYFEENGLDDVELISFDTGKDRLAALASGQADFGSVPAQAPLVLEEIGTPVKIIGLLDQAFDADAILSRDINSISDLQGQRVAYSEGSTSDILLNYALDQNGMSIDDIEKVPMPASQAATALLAGQVPVAVSYEPYQASIMAQDSDIKIIYSAGENPGIVSDVLVMTESAGENLREEAVALMKSWGQAMDYYNEHTEDARRIIAEASGANPDDMEAAFEGLEFYTLEDNFSDIEGAFPEVLADVERASRLAGITTEEIDTASLIDPSIIEALRDE